jgi:hypothetical protein
MRVFRDHRDRTANRRIKGKNMGLRGSRSAILYCRAGRSVLPTMLRNRNRRVR